MKGAYEQNMNIKLQSKGISRKYKILKMQTPKDGKLSRTCHLLKKKKKAISVDLYFGSANVERKLLSHYWTKEYEP